MSDKITLWYSVENCGDGSAYPRWFDTEELADWHQSHLDEEWGEDCVSFIEVEGDNLSCSELTTEEGYYLDLFLEGYKNDDEVKEFLEAFFPDGLPDFSVKIIGTNYYGVFVEDRLVHKKFACPEKKANDKGMKKLLGRLNM